MPFRARLLLFAAAPSAAHAGIQSVLDPRGELAAQIAEISWVLFIGGGLIFLMVMALTAIALFGGERVRALLAHRRLAIGGGILFPIVVLTALLVYVFSSGVARERQEPLAARIEVTGELWWWRLRYLDRDGKLLFETANEIRIPAGERVELLLRSNEVLHSFWIPNLAGKIDMIPGHDNRLRIKADAPGVLRGQCTEYCGAQHAKMAFHVIAQEQIDYDAWVASQMRPAREPAEPLLLQGLQLFLNNRCAECHAVRGNGAAGRLGPDLTHLGSRTHIGAGILPNNNGTLGGWISAVQDLKPGARMPSYKNFSGEDLRALSAYLESLH